MKTRPMRNFLSLSKEEAREIVKEIFASSSSVYDIKISLFENGFNALEASIHPSPNNGKFSAMVMVKGPKGEIITV